MTPGRWLLLAARSVLAGAVAGVTAAGVIFFGFGFIGLDGGDMAERAANGWDAVTSFGISRGLTLGVGIALGLTLAFFIWSHLTERFAPSRARPWLTVAAACVVVVGNLRTVAAAGGWDEVAIATVAFMALVAAAAVWWVAPWVLRSVE